MKARKGRTVSPRGSTAPPSTIPRQTPQTPSTNPKHRLPAQTPSTDPHSTPQARTHHLDGDRTLAARGQAVHRGRARGLGQVAVHGRNGGGRGGLGLALGLVGLGGGARGLGRCASNEDNADNTDHRRAGQGTRGRQAAHGAGQGAWNVGRSHPGTWWPWAPWRRLGTAGIYRGRGQQDKHRTTEPQNHRNTERSEGRDGEPGGRGPALEKLAGV